MSERPEALRLANALRDGTYLLSAERDVTEAALRRQHAEIERLREALGKYGRHLDGCAVTLGGYQCTCGFNQQEVPR